MIQRQKIVALPSEIGKSKFERMLDGTYHKIVGPATDPATGAKRIREAMAPWTIQPWTARDLQETLEVWNLAVGSIEQKMSVSPEVHHGLVSEGALDAAGIPDGFARQFLLTARRPRFSNIAPGLRVPSAESIVIQPFQNIPEPFPDLSAAQDPNDSDRLPPILLFPANGSVDTHDLGFGHPYSGPYGSVAQCNCGLYLAPCDRSMGIPFEDEFRLALPFRLAGRNARMSDMSRADGYDDLFQTGIHPYMQNHPMQLQAFLEKVYTSVEQGHWDVDADGVAGGIELWGEADTEEA